MREERAFARVLSRALVVLALSLVGFGVTGHAQAQAAGRTFGRNDPLLPVRLDAHATLSWKGSLGLGGRVDIPIATAAGLRYSQRDEVAIGLGCDVTFLAFDGSTQVAGYPTLVFQWSIGVSDRFYFVSEFGLQTRVDSGSWNGFSPNLGFGARYYLQRSFGLFGRLGWPQALSLGTNF
jgi:hypothetical protein